MVRYYQTTGIYEDSNLLRLEVEYDKRQGYVARIDPCHKRDEHSYGILYCKEYYQYYHTLTCILVPCVRRSVKKEQEACVLAEEKIDLLLEQYVIMAKNNGGRHIEIVGELEEYRQ